MKTHNGHYDKDKNYMHPDVICDGCYTKIEGGLMQVGKDRHYCTKCYNKKLKVSPINEGLFAVNN